MYGKALKEVNEVLENMDEKYTRLISPNFMNMMIKNIDWSYDFKYDVNKELKDQLISEEAKTILSIIYLRYYATQNEKQEFIKLIEQNDIQEEKLKREKYNPDKIFEKTKHKNTNELETETAVVKMPEKWYKRIIRKIKAFFKY